MLQGRCHRRLFRVVVYLSLVVLSFAHSRKFPPGFLLGTSTASYQIEGAWNVSGKGENTWDHMMLTDPDHTFDHNWADVTCDSYHHVDRDVEMLRELGLDVYRFSLSWSRLLPTGFDDQINPDGVRYYNTLINKLLVNGITPLVTIFHWDLPQSLQDIGGWPNPELADYFVDYANIALALFGDRVKLWISFNEPHQYCRQSYGLGNNAPAINRTGVAEYKCGHTILRAHAKVYRLYKQIYAAQKGKMSITLDAEWYEPKNACWPPDIATVERRVEFELGWFAHPIYTPFGGYPPIMIERIAQESKKQGLSRSRLPSFTKHEQAALIGSADFFALNHYTTFLSENQNDNPAWPQPSRDRDMASILTCDPSWKKADAIPTFSVVPWGLRKLLNWVRIHYGNPSVYITENGYPDSGGLEDYDRITYYSSYLNAMLDAIYEDNCNVVGFTAWSVMDNFEWRYGFTLKYGIYHVDFTDPDRTRTPKLSATFFKKLGKTRELSCLDKTSHGIKDPVGADNCFGVQQPCLNTSVALLSELPPVDSTISPGPANPFSTLLESCPWLSPLLSSCARPALSPFGPQTLPSGPPTLPTGPQTLPSGPPTLPTGPQTLPSGPQTLPTGPQTLPTGPQTLPTGPQILPTGPQILPFGPQTLPFSPQTLPFSPQTLLMANPRFQRGNFGHRAPTFCFSPRPYHS